jgi:3-oxoadipate enol-lactonase
VKFQSDDAEISYEVLGDGPPVVLLHPFPSHHRFWIPAAELLSTRYRVVLPDLRGHGESTSGNGPAYMDKHAADIARLCDTLGVAKAVFAGVSIGGYILFEFWRRFRDRVLALALCDTRATADNDEGRANRLKSADDVEQRGTIPFIDSMIPKLLGENTRTNRPDIVDSARKMMLKMSVAGLAAVQRGMAARPDSTPTLKSISVPTLILVGGQDVLTPVADAEQMRAGIAQSRLEVIPRAGHYAAFEQYEIAGKLLRGFLDRLPPW